MRLISKILRRKNREWRNCLIKLRRIRRIKKKLRYLLFSFKEFKVAPKNINVKFRKFSFKRSKSSRNWEMIWRKNRNKLITLKKNMTMTSELSIDKWKMDKKDLHRKINSIMNSRRIFKKNTQKLIIWSKLSIRLKEN